MRRVLARLLALRGPEWLRGGPYYNVAHELLDAVAPGDWNQAVMELGATVCTPRAPACPACPVRAHCRGARPGLVDVLPEQKARPAPVQVNLAAAVVERGGRVLLVRRPGGAADGPHVGGAADLAGVARPARPGAGAGHAARPAGGRGAAAGASVRHAITFRRIRVDVHRRALRREPPADATATPG